MRDRSTRILWVLVLLLPLACDTSEPADDGPDGNQPPRQNLIRGVSLSPEGFPDDFSRTNEFFDEVQTLGRGAVLANTAWRDDREGGTDAGEIPETAELVATESRTHGIEPVTVFGFRSGEELFVRVPGNAVNDWSNREAVLAFADMAADFADRYEPDYLFLGNETDFYAEQDPEGYEDWVTAYNDIRVEVKKVNSGTAVGTVFNVEHLLGRGLFPGWDEPQTHAWTLHASTTVDVVGLTLYPYLGTIDAEDVPSSYLDEVFDLIGEKPVVVTETGWPADNGGGFVPWTPGEDEQVTYVQRLGAMIAGHEVDAAIWLFLHPITSGLPDDELRTFGSVSLRDANGEERPVYDFWETFNTTN